MLFPDLSAQHAALRAQAKICRSRSSSRQSLLTLLLSLLPYRGPAAAHPATAGLPLSPGCSCRLWRFWRSTALVRLCCKVRALR